MQQLLKSKKSTIAYVTILAVLAIIHIIAWNSVAFSDWYVCHIFPIWVNTYGRLTSLFSFSVGEILIVIGLVLVVLAILIGVIWICYAVIGLMSSRRRRHETDLTEARKVGEVINIVETQNAGEEGTIRENKPRALWLKRFYRVFFWILLAVFMVMTLNCVILYHTTPLADQYFADAPDEYTLEDLRKLREYVVKRCNELSTQMERDEKGYLLYEGDMTDEARKSMQRLGDIYPRLSGFYPNPKPMMFSDLMCQMYMQGYYFPFSMEANYNDVMYVPNKPFTFCHELAHLKGYIYEDEANFIGYMACENSEDLFFQYSGYLSVLGYIDRDYWVAIGKNPEVYCREVQILPQVYADSVFVLEEDWERIEKDAVLDTETVDAVSDELSDASMKIHGVEDGIVSYSRVVELLLKYYSYYSLPFQQ